MVCIALAQGLGLHSSPGLHLSLLRDLAHSGAPGMKCGWLWAKDDRQVFMHHHTLWLCSKMDGAGLPAEIQNPTKGPDLDGRKHDCYTDLNWVWDTQVEVWNKQLDIQIWISEERAGFHVNKSESGAYWRSKYKWGCTESMRRGSKEESLGEHQPLMVTVKSIMRLSKYRNSKHSSRRNQDQFSWHKLWLFQDRE